MDIGDRFIGGAVYSIIYIMKIVIAVPSYKRPKVETLAYLPSARIYVAESEYEAYKKENPDADIVAVEDKYQGNLCRIRNRILDLEKGNVVCIIDDDLQKIGYWENKEEIILQGEDEVYAFLYKYTVMAMDLGARLWGVAVNKDKQVYQEQRPFSTVAYIGGPFMVHIDPELRFDERFPLKEDYDFSLQHLNMYRKVLRVNKYHYHVRQVEQAGGVADYRTLAAEQEQLKALQKKWGSHIVREDRLESGTGRKSKKTRSYDINPILSIPIRGV